MKVISGGQTGADQTGLFVARELGLETGGYAPLGWRTDEGPATWLKDYGLVETRFASYRIRTRLNARHADGTVWFGICGTPGFLCTSGATRVLAINPSIGHLIWWLHHERIEILNVAGNRKRTNPNIEADVRRVLTPVLTLYAPAR